MHKKKKLQKQITNTNQGSNPINSIKKSIRNPVVLAPLVIVFFWAIHSFDFMAMHFRSNSFHKLIAILGIFCGGLIFVAFMVLLEKAPLKLALKGHTELGEKLATLWVKFMGLIGRLSNDYHRAFLNLALICRFNGNYEKSIDACKAGLKALEKSDQFTANLPEPTKVEHKKLRSLSEFLDIAKEHIKPTFKNIMAWSLYDLGKLKEAKYYCNEALADIETSLQKQSKMAEKMENENSGDILNHDFDYVSPQTFISNQENKKHFLEVQTACLELLGTIASFEANEPLVQMCFNQSYELRMEYDKDSLCSWKLNIGFAQMNLGNLDSAKEHLESCLIDVESKPQNDRLNATLFNNIGETYRRLNMQDLAERHLEQALEIKEKLYPDGHIERLETYQNLGNLYQDNGKSKYAKKYFDLVNESPIRKLGYKNPILNQGASLNQKYSSSNI